MKNKEFDYKFSLNFLKRINEAVYKNHNFYNSFVFKDYDLWHSYQMLIFADIKQYSKYGESYFCKNKKVLVKIKNFIFGCFSIFISTLAILILILKRKKIIIYSVDRINSKYKSDLRIEAIYNFLYENNLKYTEFFHTIFGKDFLKNFLIRKRFSIYMEGFDFLYSIFYKRNSFSGIENIINLDQFSSKEKSLAIFILTKYFYYKDISKFKISIFSKILKVSSVKALFTIDDVRYYNELILACKINNIKTYAVQHGHFTKYHVGWLYNNFSKKKIIKPNKLLVWSDYWKRELLRLGTYFSFKDIEVGGVNKIKIIKKYKKGKRIDKSINLLIPYEADAPKKEVKGYMDKFINLGGVKIFFKVRSDVLKRKQLEDYGIYNGYNKKIIVVSDMEKVIDKIDIVVGVYSTFLYDVILYKKPVLILSTSMDYGYGMIKNNLANIISENEKDLLKRLLEIKNINYATLIKRREILFGKSISNLKNTLNKIKFSDNF